MRRKEILHAPLHFGQIFRVGRGLVAAARTAAVVIHGRRTAPEVTGVGELLSYVRRADGPAVECEGFGLAAAGSCHGRDAAQYEYVSHAEQQAHCQRYPD